MRFNDRRFYMPLTVVALLLLNASASYHAEARQGQQAQPKCPTTQVTCPDSVEIGGKLTFTVNFSGGDQQVTPTYNWTVSAGSIQSGQGMPTIEVSTEEMAPNSTVTATVDLGGFSRECGYGSTAASCTTTVLRKAEARKLDEYGTLKPADENARLDNFMIELLGDPTATGYIIAYGGRASRAGDAKKAATRAKDYLVTKRSLDPQRAVIVDGGHREQPTLELWVVPSGAQPPQPTPTVKPTNQAKPAKPKSNKGRIM